MVETDEKKRSATYFTFDKINTNRTRFTLDLYLRKNPVLQLMFALAMKKKLNLTLRDHWIILVFCKRSGIAS